MQIITFNKIINQTLHRKFRISYYLLIKYT